MPKKTNKTVKTEEQKRKEQEVLMLISDEVIEDLSKVNTTKGNWFAEFMKDKQNKQFFQKQVSKQIVKDIGKDFVEKIAAGKVSEDKKKELCSFAAATVANQYRKVTTPASANTEFQRALDAFRGGITTRRTIQMTMLRQALQDAMAASNKLQNKELQSDNPFHAENLTNYMDALKNLNAAVDTYISYKEQNINGRTAINRFAAAKELKKTVVKNMQMLNMKLHQFNKIPKLTSEYMKETVANRAIRLGGRIQKAYASYPNAKYEKMGAFGSLLTVQLVTVSNGLPSSQGFAANETAAAALAAEKNYAVWKKIETGGFAADLKKNSSVEDMMKDVLNKKVFKKPDDADDFLNMDASKAVSEVKSAIKQEMKKRQPKDEPDPDFYAYIGI